MTRLEPEYFGRTMTADGLAGKKAEGRSPGNKLPLLIYTAERMDKYMSLIGGPGLARWWPINMPFE